MGRSQVVPLPVNAYASGTYTTPSYFSGIFSPFTSLLRSMANVLDGVVPHNNNRISLPSRVQQPARTTNRNRNRARGWCVFKSISTPFQICSFKVLKFRSKYRKRIEKNVDLFLKFKLIHGCSPSNLSVISQTLWFDVMFLWIFNTRKYFSLKIVCSQVSSS